jgi:Fe/S biogenesis protein NfuA
VSTTTDTSTDTATDTAIVTVTPEALDKVLDLRAGETDADRLGLRIEVTGTRGVDFTYDLAFEVIDEARDEDVVFEVGESLQMILPVDDVDKLRGATLDVPSTPGQVGLVLRNPNRPDLGGAAADVELTGTVADQVRQLLDLQINPAIAAHGGFAELVEVAGNAVRVRLGGGCQGCAMSRMTVAAGIEQAIKERIGEEFVVEDVTDHASGDNPYYAES